MPSTCPTDRPSRTASPRRRTRSRGRSPRTAAGRRSGTPSRPARAPTRTAGTARWPATPTTGTRRTSTWSPALGPAWYRFSIAWPRILPDGTGRVESAGLDYYDRLVDAALARGVAPTATLYHWDLPQALEDRDGWLNRDTAEAFADYATVVHERLGDRVRVWATHNEPWCAAYLGYAAGVHAPGRREGGAGHRAAHHLMLGHGLAAARLHEAGVTDLGIVLNLAPFWPETPGRRGRRPPTSSTRSATGSGSARSSTARTTTGCSPSRPSWPTPAWSATATSTWSAARPTGSASTTTRRSAPRPPTRTRRRTPRPRPTRAPDPCRSWSASRAPTSAGRSTPPGSSRCWSTPIDAPACRSWSPRTARPTPTTRSTRTARTVDDQDRIDYLRDHIAATERAREAGADVRAYIVWTLLDNFEWAEGYTKTFGIVHVDPADQTRTPKASYHWLADTSLASP